MRAVGVPDERMKEDRLRALRGNPLRRRVSVSHQPHTWRAIKASAPHMGRLSSGARQAGTR